MSVRRCPFCGKQWDDYHIPPKELSALMQKISLPVRIKIQQTIDERQKVELLASTDIKYFLCKIVGTNERAIELALDTYWEKFISDPDRGLNYLAGIINSQDKNIERKQKAEEEMYGIAPPRLNEQT